MHQQSVKWLLNKLNEINKNEKILILTHHIPSYSLIDSKYEKYDNSAYASDLDYIMEKYPNIVGWLFGHTHTTVDEKIHSTSCQCNPRGYCTIVKERYGTVCYDFDDLDNITQYKTTNYPENKNYSKTKVINV